MATEEKSDEKTALKPGAKQLPEHLRDKWFKAKVATFKRTTKYGPNDFVLWVTLMDTETGEVVHDEPWPCWFNISSVDKKYEDQTARRLQSALYALGEERPSARPNLLIKAASGLLTHENGQELGSPIMGKELFIFLKSLGTRGGAYPDLARQLPSDTTAPLPAERTKVKKPRVVGAQQIARHFFEAFDEVFTVPTIAAGYDMYDVDVVQEFARKVAQELLAARTKPTE